MIWRCRMQSDKWLRKLAPANFRPYSKRTMSNGGTTGLISELRSQLTPDLFRYRCREKGVLITVFTSRSLRAASISAILTDSRDTMLALVSVFGALVMTPGHKTCLWAKIFHLHVKDQMTSNFLKSGRHRLSFFKRLKGYTHLLHFLTHGVLPECVNILPVESDTLVIGLRYFNTILMCTLVIAFIHSNNNTIASLDCIRHPP